MACGSEGGKHRPRNYGRVRRSCPGSRRAVAVALWPVSDRATRSTEGLPSRWRPSVGRFGGVRDPRRAGRPFRWGQRPAPSGVQLQVELTPAAGASRLEATAVQDSRFPSATARILHPEGMRMASGLIGNEVPRMGLRVRVPCPPLPPFTASCPRWPLLVRRRPPRGSFRPRVGVGCCLLAGFSRRRIDDGVGVFFPRRGYNKSARGRGGIRHRLLFALSILAQVSRSGTVRLKTGWPGCESRESTQK